MEYNISIYNLVNQEVINLLIIDESDSEEEYGQPLIYEHAYLFSRMNTVYINQLTQNFNINIEEISINSIINLIKTSSLSSPFFKIISV